MQKRLMPTTFFLKLPLMLLLALCFVLFAPKAFALEYTRNAVPDGSAAYPGVYRVTAVKGDSDATATIGIPSLAKQNLENGPTTESPAIIMGAAVPYEVKTGPTEFTPIGGALYPPYSYFRYSIIEELGPDGTTHRKMSGFDGSYVIIRVDVSDLIAGAPEGSFLHVKQEGNKALMVSLLHEAYSAGTGRATFSDALGNKVGVYSVANGGLSMKDKDGSDQSVPYIDVILMSSGTLVAGADTGSTDPNVMTADVKLRFYVDQTNDYNPTLDYESMVNTYTPATGQPTLAQMMLDKYYKEPEGGQGVTSYVVKGSDLEIEIMNDAQTPRQFWSLRKAMSWYDNSPIKMICEVPVLEGLLVDGGRRVIFDVNSFDIQIANHQSTGAAALTVRNGSLTLQDSFNTTGAELAVGNNARMSIEAGGTLVIDDTCQVEVEYDAASVAPGSETPAPELNFGIITIEDGGTIINKGVISIEGTEGKPIDPAAPAIRDMQAAELHIKPGGKLINNGALLSYGRLYNTGTIENHGHYDQVIESNDPDKGHFTYHKGIQVAWKDDVTQQGVQMGRLINGDDGNSIVTGAQLINDGDIVLVPGLLENYGLLQNNSNGNIYLCAVNDAVIPFQATYTPLILEQRILFDSPVSIYFTNYPNAELTNQGRILAAQVEITGNGQTGALTTAVDGDMIYDICIDSFGPLSNSGTIALDGVYIFGNMSNTGTLNNKVVLSANMQQAGSLTDSTGFSDVYNGMRTENGWTHASCAGISIAPPHQYGTGGQTVQWTVSAQTEEPNAEGVRYYLLAYEGNGSAPKQRYTIAGGGETVLTSPELPMIGEGNAVYRFHVLDGLYGQYANATVRVTSQIFTAPVAIPDLVYNGKDQTLITAGGTNQGVLQYRLGEDGEWSANPPAAKNAGSYKVYFRLASETEQVTYQSVTVVIGKKPVTVSGDDFVTTLNADLAELTCTVSGLIENETLNGVQVATDADKAVAGTYSVTPTVTGENPNYEITLKNGKYVVTEHSLTVVAKDKYGVFSDEVTYTGFNIELTIPQGAAAYYSTTEPLTKDNFKTRGATALKVQPATAGTHTVYYYVTDASESYGVSGSKQVIIDKARQAAPDSTKLFTRSESYLNSGDGIIDGLTPRKMEYREKGNDGSYTVAYMEKVYVVPGTYLVRMAGDENHYPSLDTEVVVEAGEPITIWLNCNNGELPEVSVPEGSSITVSPDPDDPHVLQISGLACGDLLPQPKDPALLNADFLGWFTYSGKYDFNTPVTMSTTLTAGWKPSSIAFKLPNSTTSIGESAFEGLPMTSVELPPNCATIYPGAFKNCTGLKQIVIPNPKIIIYSGAFDGCSGVQVFAPASSYAKYLCTEDNGFVFIETVG